MNVTILQQYNTSTLHTHRHLHSNAYTIICTTKTQPNKSLERHLIQHKNADAAAQSLERQKINRKKTSD